MFTKIKNLFSKKKEKKETIVSAITLYTDDSGEIFVDLQIKDHSEESIDHLASLLTMYNSAAFVQVNDIIKYQCRQNKESDLHKRLMEIFIEKVGTSYFLDNSNERSNKPCIKPDEMI